MNTLLAGFRLRLQVSSPLRPSTAYSNDPDIRALVKQTKTIKNSHNPSGLIMQELCLMHAAFLKLCISSLNYYVTTMHWLCLWLWHCVILHLYEE